MTCIVGLEHNGSVFMGGDAASSANGNLQRINTPKVFIRQNLIIGYTWSFRMGQLIKHAGDDYPPMSEAGDPETYLINSFVPFLQKTFKAGGWLKEKDNVKEGGQFLVGLEGELFEIGYDFAVLRSSDGYNAVGSGTYYAMGAMYSLTKYAVYPPAGTILRALESAAYFSTTVSGPFTILELSG